MPCTSPRLAALLAAAVALVSPALAGAQAPSAAALPDLDQEAPAQVSVATVGEARRPDYRLGFRSAVRNLGRGPLIVDGRRTDSRRPAMVADQLVQAGGGVPARIATVGRLSFVREVDHQHWHLLGFERYELRRAGSTRALLRDSKSGFCLGDRYRVGDAAPAAAAPAPVYTSRCGLGQRGRTSIREGISVGFGDDYAAHLEHQDLPISGLDDGRYVLVHRVNTERRIHETDYTNDAASLLLDLRWRGGRPSVRVVRSCPDSARCDRPAGAAPRAAQSRVRVRTVASGLEIPWDIAFLPGGGALVTERPGRVRLLDPAGRLRRAPVARIAVSARGEGGLLGVALDPAFARNRRAYLYFTTAAGMRLERWRWTGSRLVRETLLVDAIAAGDVHDSGRIAFGPDRRLYVATGDAGEPRLAQDPASLNGKLLALTPAQYRGAGVVRPAVVAMGLRNSQGFDWQPGTGDLYANDHGPSGFDGPEGFDEIDRIAPGGNYGWPEAIGDATGGGAFVAPLRVYAQPIAPSGAAFVTRAGSRWTGDYVLASLRGEELRRIELRGGRIVHDQPLLHGTYGRLRTVREGPDGALYVLTSNRDGRGTPRGGDDRILCVLPPRS
jgi:glucose/arabinose dehydrogenase